LAVGIDLRAEFMSTGNEYREEFLGLGMEKHREDLKVLVGRLRGVALLFQSTALEASTNRKVPVEYLALIERIQKPEIGDLVAEVTSFLGGEIEDLNSVGYLVEVVKQSADAPGKTFIKSLDGRLIEWINCRFIGLPESMPRV
jgi:hypothetical protein